MEGAWDIGAWECVMRLFSATAIVKQIKHWSSSWCNKATASTREWKCCSDASGINVEYYFYMFKYAHFNTWIIYLKWFGNYFLAWHLALVFQFFLVLFYLILFFSFDFTSLFWIITCWNSIQHDHYSYFKCRLVRMKDSFNIITSFCPLCPCH